MFAKLLTLIIIAGLTALALLLTRQAQIDTVHDITKLHHRIQQQRHAAWSLRNEIANACRPSVIEKLRALTPDQWVDLTTPQKFPNQGQQTQKNQISTPLAIPESPSLNEELSHGG